MTNYENNISMNRRSLLAFVGGGSALGGVGYFWLDSDEPPENRLLFVRLINVSEKSESFQLQLWREETLVFDETYYQVPSPSETDHYDSRTQSPTTHMIKPTWDEGPAKFEIRFRLLEQDEWETFQLWEYDGTHIGVDLRIFASGIAAAVPNPYQFETTEERTQARDFIENELDKQSDREQFGNRSKS